MISLSNLTALAHVFGYVLAIGAATAKLVLLLKVRGDAAFAQAYLKVVRPLTLLIVIGLVLATLSGIGWLLQGYPFTPQMIVKIVMVGAIWLLGPVIDKVVEPRFMKLAPAAGQSASPEFWSAYNRYLGVEVVADALFYAVLVMWMLR